MYIELFLLDNMLMNILICRLSAALCGRHLRIARAALFSTGGAIYAALAYLYPVFSSLLCKILLCIVMAFALPCDSIMVYMANLLAMCAAAFIIGGSAFFMVYAAGGAVDGSLIGGIPLRIMLFIASAAAAMPSFARRLRQHRIGREQTHMLTVVKNGRTYNIAAMVDTGNSLTDPVSGLPVAVAFIPGESGDIPIPAATVQGRGVMMAFHPEKAEYMGYELDVLIALSNIPIQPQALIPSAALPDIFF